MWGKVVRCGEKYLSLPGDKLSKKPMRFLGTIEAKIDSKGRAFLPAQFRKELQGGGEAGLVMRKDIFQPCLVLYPESVWERQTDALRSRLNRWDCSHQSIFRQFVAEAEAVTLDANGRMLIPKRLLKAAGISQSVKFIGMDDTVEIWSDGPDGSPFMAQEDFGKAIQEIMAQGAGRGQEADGGGEAGKI